MGNFVEGKDRFLQPRHLHPFAFIYMVGKGIKDFGIIFLPILYAAMQKTGPLYPLLLLAGILLLLLFWSLLSFIRFRYWIFGHEFRIEQGVFFQKKRYIPFSRIQGVELEQSLLHRLIGLVRVRIDTAGSGPLNQEGEGILSAVAKEDGELLKEMLSTAHLPSKNDAEKIPASPTPSWRLSARRLLFAGATSGNIGFFLAFFFAAYNLVDQIIPWDDWFVTLFSYFTRQYQSTATLLFGILLLFLISWLFAIGGTILLYDGFHLRKEGEKLIIQRGLLTRYTTTLSIHKIQSIHFAEGWIRQPFRFGMLRIDVSGYQMKGAGETVLSPLIRREEIDPFLQTFLPQYAGKLQGEKKPLSPKGWIEAALFFWFPWILLITASFFLSVRLLPLSATLTNLLFLPLLLIPLFPLSTYFYLRDGGFRYGTDEVVLTFRHFFTRYTYIVPFKRVQSITVRQSPIGHLLHTSQWTALISSYKTVSIPLKYMKEEETALLFSRFSDYWGERGARSRSQLPEISASGKTASSP